MEFDDEIIKSFLKHNESMEVKLEKNIAKSKQLRSCCPIKTEQLRRRTSNREERENPA